MSLSGPSPRAWGLPPGSRSPRSASRAIPTCVGTTPGGGAPGARRAGHPHVRGDYTDIRTVATPSTGPSPRAWGLRSRFSPQLRQMRAIPTCVGTTTRVANGAPTTPGHPHVRGDYMASARRCPTGAGPSPRAWGLRSRGDDQGGLSRAIPTCVGTTGGFGLIPRRWAGHPHVRGDYLGSGKRGKAAFGPSPRAWGLRLWCRYLPPAVRAIPTCVGTTRWWTTSAGSRPGHPHVRGDYGGEAEAGGGRFGPSPRAWGLRRAPLSPRLACRAIPTCVGTTLLGGSWVLRVPGHPHVRGDYPVALGRRDHPAGPSPRAWGLRPPSLGFGSGGRAIPTCVGTTPGPASPGPPTAGHPHVRGDYTSPSSPRGA